MKDIQRPVAILHCGSTPTLGYWFQGFLLDKSCVFFDLSQKLNFNDLDSFNTIIIVRYLNLLDISKLKELYNNGCSIYLFIDDNLLGVNLFSDLPYLYILTLWWRILRFKYSLNLFVSCIFVTNDFLHERTSHFLKNNSIQIKTVSSFLSPPIITSRQIYRIIYFGSSSHVNELNWLYSLFSMLQSQRDDCIIEIIANKRWRNIFKSIPRIKIIYPMPWDTFLLDSSNSNVDIGLVPIFPNTFNKCRSYTKFFDITRMNSVGIYSDQIPYRGFIRNQIDGCIIPNLHNLWIDKINYLLDNKSVRSDILANAQQRVIDISRTSL